MFCVIAQVKSAITQNRKKYRNKTVKSANTQNITVFNLPQHKRRERLSPEHPKTKWPPPHQQTVCYPPMSTKVKTKNK